MKLFLVISNLQSGGAEKVVSVLASSFARVGHDVTLIVLDNREAFYPLHVKVSIKHVYPFPPSTTFRAFFFLVHTILALRRDFMHQRPSAALSFMASTNVTTIISGRLAGIPVFISDRTTLKNREKTWVSVARFVIYRFAFGAIFQTPGVIASYKAAGIRLPHRVAIIPNPVLPVSSPSVPPKLKRNVILAVGRLSPEKGFDVLIKAFSKIQADGWELRIAGEGPERPHLSALISSLGLKNVSLLGQIREINLEYARASIFTMTSRYEGYPNALCEAMVHGCACVSFNCDFGPSEIIQHGETGLLIPPGETPLINAITMLIENRELRMKLSQNAPSFSASLSPQLIMERWISFINTVHDAKSIS